MKMNDMLKQIEAILEAEKNGLGLSDDDTALLVAVRKVVDNGNWGVSADGFNSPEEDFIREVKKTA